ncbi:MAG: hypothetical protein M1457_08945 [bacterium]|nr:hypothetical protein [bacterium]
MNVFRQSFPAPDPPRRLSRRARPRLAVALLALAAALATGCARPTPERAARLQAEQLADRVVKAMGGRRALTHPRFLHFDFVIREKGKEIVRRSHWWDRQTGRCRLESNSGGRPYVVLFNIQTHEGRALEMFTPVSPDRLPAMLQQAEALQAGDSFWLLGSLRLRDPNARVTWEGENPVADRICPTLGFQPLPGFGLDPGDRISFYIQPDTWRPLGWTFTLSGQPDVAQTYLWQSWQKLGDLELPVEFVQYNGPRTVTIENLYAPGTIENQVFFRF